MLGVFLSVVSFMHKSLWVTPTNTSETWLVLQVCMETQRFERLMEYFKNEDNNIDFMVCSHTHAQTHTHMLLMAYRSHCNPLKLLNHPAHMACEALSESSSFIITIRRLEETVGIKSEYFERLSSRGRPKLTPRGDTYTFTGLQSL